jgi:hypothetical protein
MKRKRLIIIVDNLLTSMTQEEEKKTELFIQNNGNRILQKSEIERKRSHR